MLSIVNSPIAIFVLYSGTGTAGRTAPYPKISERHSRCLTNLNVIAHSTSHLHVPSLPLGFKSIKSVFRHGCSFPIFHPHTGACTLVMAITTAKRKRPFEDNSTPNTPSPKRKALRLSPDFFEVRDILQHKNGLYLVDWEDNPTTGEKYSPTWEPRDNLNQEALLHWEQNQVAQRDHKREPKRAKNSKKRKTESQQLYGDTTTTSHRRPSKRRIIESSPDTDSSTTDGKDVIKGGAVGYQVRKSASIAGSPPTSPPLASNPSSQDTTKTESHEDTAEPSSWESQTELIHTKLAGSRASAQELEVQLSQKSIDYSQYTSFSAPATQESTAVSANSVNHDSSLGSGNANHSKITSLGDTSQHEEKSIEDRQSTSLSAPATQEFIANSASSADNEFKPNDDSLSYSKIASSGENSQQEAAISTLESKANSASAASTANNESRTNSGNTTCSQPIPFIDSLPQESTEQSAEDLAHISAGTNSISEKVRKQTADSVRPPVPSITTSDQNEDIPESSPLQVFPVYHCFRAWTDKYIYIHAKTCKGQMCDHFIAFCITSHSPSPHLT